MVRDAARSVQTREPTSEAVRLHPMVQAVQRPRARSEVRGAVAEWVRASTGDRTFDGSSPTSVKTFLFGTLAIPFTPLVSVFRMRQ